MYGMYKSDIFADCLTISCIQIPVEYVTLWPHSIPVPRGESKVDEKLNDPSLNHIIGSFCGYHKMYIFRVTST